MKPVLIFLVLIHSTGSYIWAQETQNVTDDIQLVKLSDNAYMHVSWVSSPEFGRYSCNGLIFSDGGEAFLFDTPPDNRMTETLVTFIEDQMKLRIRGFVPNHFHEDCMGGLGYLKSRGIESFANHLTVSISGKKGLPVPATGFRDSLELKAGNKRIFCYYPGEAHSTDNIVVWIPSEKILFAGCMCKSMDTNNLGNTADGNIVEYAATIKKVIRKFSTASIVIPGHGRSGGMELLYHTLHLAANPGHE